MTRMTDRMTAKARDDDGIAHTMSADARALRDLTGRGLPPLSTLAKNLESNTRRKRKHDMAHRNRRKWMILAGAAALLMITGVVFATTGSGIISFWVDTDGKSDEQIEDEIHDQLIEGGMTDPSVDVERNPNHTRVEIEGDQGERHIKLIRKEKGGDTGVIEMHHEPFDTEREPGMTDEELEAKIQAQMEARGMDGTVKVEGDEIRIRVEKEEEIEE